MGSGDAAAAARSGRRHSSGIIGIFRDVTEQKRAEEKIQDGVRRRDEFLAMLSHELRNPLGAIVTATALLKRDARPPPTRPAVSRASSSGSRSRWPRSSTICWRRAASPRTRSSSSGASIDLRSVAREAADAVRALIETRGLTLHGGDRRRAPLGRRRSRAPPADPREPAHQRGQVHAARRPRQLRVGARGRRTR